MLYQTYTSPFPFNALNINAKGHMVNKLITRTFLIGKLIHVYSLSLSLYGRTTS